MGLFKPYQRAEKQAGEPEPEAPGAGAKKKIATPTRREAEQARRDRLHPVLTKKQVKSRERAAKLIARDEAQKELDAQPARQLARDFVDSRRSLSQFAMPLIFVVLLFTMFGGMFNEQVLTYTSVLTWVIIAMLGVDVANTEVQFGKLLNKRLPNAPMRGLRMYVFNRMINPRRMRLPPPRVKFGDKV